MWCIAIFFTLNSLIHGCLQNKWPDIAQIQHKVTSVHLRLEMMDLFVKINIFKGKKRSNWRGGNKAAFMYLFTMSVFQSICVHQVAQGVLRSAVLNGTLLTEWNRRKWSSGYFFDFEFWRSKTGMAGKKLFSCNNHLILRFNLHFVQS